MREGIVKHNSAHDKPGRADEYEPGMSACLESQIADVADEIAYNNHDIDDGLASEMLSVEALKDVSCGRRISSASRPLTKTLTSRY